MPAVATEAGRFTRKQADPNLELVILAKQENDPDPAIHARAMDARDRLVVRCRGLAAFYAKRFRHRWKDSEDLIQEGVLGIFEAISHFDPTRGVTFAYYAVYWIRAKIQDFLERMMGDFRVPLETSNQALEYNRTAHFMRGSGVTPTHEAITAEMGMGNIEAQHVLRVARLMAPTDQKDVCSLNDKKSPSPEAEATEKELKLAVDQLLSCLHKRDANILRARFGLDDGEAKTLKEVGDQFGLTRERVRQIQGRSFKRCFKEAQRDKHRETRRIAL